MGWGAGRGPCLPQEGGGMSARPEGGRGTRSPGAGGGAGTQQRESDGLVHSHAHSLAHFCTQIIATGTVFGTTGADMEFVKNFTHPDFQAKSFTPQKCVICDSFFGELTA